MSSERLRDALALLVRENHHNTAALSANAERTIRRRIGWRWAGRIGALVAVAALGLAMVGAYGSGDGGDGAIKSPIATPTIGVAAATFPVEGGQEFVSAAAGLKCGDPVPTPHPAEHDVALTLTATNASYAGGQVENYEDLPQAMPTLSQSPDTELGVLANSAISLIIERDGVVVGVSTAGEVNLGWNQLRPASNGYQGFSPLAAPWIHCPGDDASTESTFEQGTYDVVAITRVFSTPESVALFQEIGLSNGAWNLDPAYLDPEGIYLPGSYDCAQLIAQQSPARGCLPDFKPGSKLDAEAGTVTLLYDTEDLVEEFSAVLVSDPVTVTIPGADALTGFYNASSNSLGTFDSIDDFTCGASAGNNMMPYVPGTRVATALNEQSAGPTVEGGPFTAQVSGMGVPDGSRIDLVAGARVVYVEETLIPDPETNSRFNAQTVVGSAAVSAASPVTTDRFAGPKTMSFTSDPLTACPGIDLAAVTSFPSFVLVGTWHIVAPDGTESTVDVGDPLWHWGGGG